MKFAGNKVADEHGSEKAKRHANQDSAQSSYNRSKNHWKDSEAGGGGGRRPFGAEKEGQQANLPDSRHAGEEHIDCDGGNAKDGRDAAEEENCVHDALYRIFQAAGSGDGAGICHPEQSFLFAGNERNLWKNFTRRSEKIRSGGTPPRHFASGL